jgi:hypothetical protein
MTLVPNFLPEMLVSDAKTLRKYKRISYMALSAAISILLNSFGSSRIYGVSVQ